MGIKSLDLGWFVILDRQNNILNYSGYLNPNDFKTKIVHVTTETRRESRLGRRKQHCLSLVI